MPSQDLCSGAARPPIMSPSSDHDGSHQRDPLREGSSPRLTSCGLHECGEAIHMLRLTDVLCEAASWACVPSRPAAIATQRPNRNGIRPLEGRSSKQNHFTMGTLSGMMARLKAGNAAQGVLARTTATMLLTGPSHLRRDTTARLSSVKTSIYEGRWVVREHRVHHCRWPALSRSASMRPPARRRPGPGRRRTQSSPRSGDPQTPR
jgi:hypothetical protein